MRSIVNHVVLGIIVMHWAIMLGWVSFLFVAAARRLLARSQPRIPVARAIAHRPRCGRCGQEFDPRLSRCLCTWVR